MHFSTEGGSETESTVDSDFGRGELLATTSSDPFFPYKPRSDSPTTGTQYTTELAFVMFFGEHLHEHDLKMCM